MLFLRLIRRMKNFFFSILLRSSIQNAYVGVPSCLFSPIIKVPLPENIFTIINPSIISNIIPTRIISVISFSPPFKKKKRVRVLRTLICNNLNHPWILCTAHPNGITNKYINLVIPIPINISNIIQSSLMFCFISI